MYCLLGFIFIFTIYVTGQTFSHVDTNDINDHKEKIVWCTVGFQELKKCQNFEWAADRDQIKVGYETAKIECISATNKDECMQLLDTGNATMTTLDAGEVFVGGRYHSLIPIAQEVLSGGFQHYYGVAVIKKGNLPDVYSLTDLRNKKACFAGVQSFAGWMLPVSTLMKEGIMEIIDCNNHVKTASAFFGKSCAINSLSDRYNPIGDNSDKLCQICTGKLPGGRCTYSDPYGGFDGAFKCLLEVGDIAFLKHFTVPLLLKKLEYTGKTVDEFELLCKDGTRKPISEYLSCNWGRVPSDAIVTSSVVYNDKRVKYQKFLQKFADKYPNLNNETTRRIGQNQGQQYDNFGNRIYDNRNTGNQLEYDQFENRIQRPTTESFYGNRYEYDQYGNRVTNYRKRRESYSNNPDDFVNNWEYGHQTDNETDPNHNRDYYEVFSLFESVPKYGEQGDLLFSDTAIGFAPVVENMQVYSNFLGETMKQIMAIRECPVNKMTLCVTSDAEENKCIKMRTATKVQLLKPEIDCYKGHSQIHCMQAIRAGSADVTVLDASDVYTAGLNFDLIPFISEVYDLDEAEYYVVAVAKESDPSTELTYLRTKNTCHGGINTAAGWVYPLAFLISNGWIRPYGCNSVRAAAEYFSKSCIPGAISTEYNTGVPYDNMCDLCHGASFRYCRRDASEDYYGHTGAFRCLVEGGGDVAFVKHTTVTENTGLRKREWWTRDNLNDDYELLCPDGTRAEINEYKKCNLGKVKANAIVTRGGYNYNETQVNAYINLFMYAQTFYGRKTADEFSFSMFTSQPPYADLIFQDATTQLKIIEPSKRYYSNYLGLDFMRARRIVDCYASASIMKVSILVLFLSTTFAVLFVPF